VSTLKRRNSQQQGITNYIDFKSIDEYSVKVERLGGKVVLQKIPVPGMGYLQYVLIQREQ
jgi:predicted enzyme related to lactoylglutathione lyase